MCYRERRRLVLFGEYVDILKQNQEFLPLKKKSSYTRDTGIGEGMDFSFFPSINLSTIRKETGLASTFLES